MQSDELPELVIKGSRKTWTTPLAATWSTSSSTNSCNSPQASMI